jgi:hypothetical protein
MKATADIEEYNRERDKVLLTANAPEFVRWAESKGVIFSSPAVAEIAYHKMRSACAHLPLDIRMASDKWLRDHNYESWLSP